MRLKILLLLSWTAILTRANVVPNQPIIADLKAIMNGEHEGLSGAKIGSALLMSAALSSKSSNQPWFGGFQNLEDNDSDGTPVMIEKAGYPAETHFVTTEDGYILQMHRIPHGKNDSANDSESARPVIFLQHGLLSSSADWVVAGPGKSLAYILADEGYDVWMGNYRGNSYSKSHIHLDPTEYDFWTFSFDQMADYDLPLMVTYTVNYTQQERIYYVGHSMGTTTFMIMANLHPEVQKHIKLANFFAPVGYVEHLKGPLRLLAPIEPEVEDVLHGLAIGVLFPSNHLMDYVADALCKDHEISQIICSSVIFLLCGYDPPQLNTTLLDAIVHHTPAGASVDTVAQYGQMINSGNLKGFDYRDKKKNQEVYGQEEPPVYDVKKVTAPVVAYWGDNDWLAQSPDLVRLTADLPNLVESYKVPFEGWNHLDFMYGIDAPELVYKELLRQLKNAE